MNYHKTAFALIGAISTLACAPVSGVAPKTEPFVTPAAFSEQAAEATAMLTPAARIKADVDFLADDARLGREAGSDGYRDAALYVAARMAQSGMSPIGQNWFQTIDFRGAVSVQDTAKLSVTGAGGSVTTLTPEEDFLVFANGGKEAFSVSAPAVFVGYGIHAPEFDHDDYAGLEVAGKIAVFLSGAPESFDSEARAHFSQSASKRASAAAHGAVAVIGLPTEASEVRFSWERFQRLGARSSFQWVGPHGESSDKSLQIAATAYLNSTSSELLFAGAPRRYAEIRAAAEAGDEAIRGFPLEVSIAMSGAQEFTQLPTSANVIGLIDGADPALRDEYVVLTAHLDHIGFSQEAIDKGEDGINNGAMDNALGVAVMLEAARALAAEPPARSVIVAAVTAEEKGLVGADYFVEFPPVPRTSIVADVNLDMPLMLHSFRDVVAFGAEHSSLGPVAEKAVRDAGAVLAPDPIPEQNIFVRSDHYRFVERGIPALFLWPGFANGGEEAFTEFFSNCYHRPCDEATQPILYDDVARFADVNIAIARAIADDPSRPTWNEGDIFGRVFAGD